MFEVEKPRRFHYEPRFYDPEKEKWEAMKKKYAIEQEKKEAENQRPSATSEDGGEELAYFEQRVREIDQQRRESAQKMTCRDLFRKREMPKFNYQPRFNGQAPQSDSAETHGDVDNALYEKYQPKRKIKIKRRFDISDTDYMKPISGTKIILYCFVVFLLITLIIRF